MNRAFCGSRSRATTVAVVMVFAILCARPTTSQVIKPEQLHERGKVLRSPIMPAQFRGHWSEDRRDCNTDPVEESQVWITGTALNGYEMIGHFTRIAIETRRRAVATLRTDAEGLVFVSKKALTLSPDGGSLTLRDEDDTGNRRFYRCPTKTASR